MLPYLVVDGLEIVGVPCRLEAELHVRHPGDLEIRLDDVIVIVRVADEALDRATQTLTADLEKTISLRFW